MRGFVKPLIPLNGCKGTKKKRNNQIIRPFILLYHGKCVTLHFWKAYKVQKQIKNNIQNWNTILETSNRSGRNAG